MRETVRAVRHYSDRGWSERNCARRLVCYAHNLIASDLIVYDLGKAQHHPVEDHQRGVRQRVLGRIILRQRYDTCEHGALVFLAFIRP